MPPLVRSKSNASAVDAAALDVDKVETRRDGVPDRTFAKLSLRVEREIHYAGSPFLATFCIASTK